MSLQSALTALAASGASALKCLLMSGRPSQGGRPGDTGRPLVVMGNGPSLRQTLDNERGSLERADLMAVNFAANAPEFTSLQPEFYVLADPHFFNGADTDPNVARLWDNLLKSHWGMTLFIPCARRRDFSRRYGDAVRRTGIRVKWYNLTPVEGIPAISRLMFRMGLGMPRPRNVLIPALMMGLREGYRTIYTVGADHTWSRTLSVDDRNRVLSVQPHFYADNPAELERVAAEYAGYHLHDILGSLTIAFRSYFAIDDYARSLGGRIINSTPGSMIDAFERAPLP